MAERIRHHIQAQSFPHRRLSRAGSLTISLAVAVFPEDAADPKEPYRKSRRRPLQGKENRRNRVEV